MVETLYYNPKTGALARACVSARWMEVPAALASDRQAPGLLRCAVHGRYEPVAAFPTVRRGALYLRARVFRAFLIAAVAADTGNVVAFRTRWHGAVRALRAWAPRGPAEAIVPPTVLVDELERALGMPLRRALAALATLPLPKAATDRRGSSAVLRRYDGTVVGPASRRASSTAALRPGRSWIVGPTPRGWVVYRQVDLRNTWGHGAEWIYTLGGLLLLRSCHSCEEYALRAPLLRMPAEGMAGSTGFAALRYFIGAAQAITNVLDAGWTAARLLDAAR